MVQPSPGRSDPMPMVWLCDDDSYKSRNVPDRPAFTKTLKILDRVYFRTSKGFANVVVH